MSMMILKCPKCGAEAKLSLTDTSYSGPRRCWKCHEFFTITIHNNRVTSCEPLSKEDYERQQEAKKAAEKSRGGIDFVKREEPGSLQKAAEQSRGGIDFARQEQFEFPQNSTEKSRGGIDFVKQEEPKIPQNPPEKQRDYAKPLSPKKPSNQTGHEGPAHIYPPDRIRTFVPLEDIKEDLQKPQKPASPQERQRDYTKPLSPKKPSNQTGHEGPAHIYPPDRIRTFVPLEDIKEEPEKPQKPTPRRKDATPL